MDESVLSTSPFATQTHWAQSILTLKYVPLACCILSACTRQAGSCNLSQRHAAQPHELPPFSMPYLMACHGSAYRPAAHKHLTLRGVGAQC